MSLSYSSAQKVVLGRAEPPQFMRPLNSLITFSSATLVWRYMGTFAINTSNTYMISRFAFRLYPKATEPPRSGVSSDSLVSSIAWISFLHVSRLTSRDKRHVARSCSSSVPWKFQPTNAVMCCVKSNITEFPSILLYRWRHIIPDARSYVLIVQMSSIDWPWPFDPCHGVA